MEWTITVLQMIPWSNYGIALVIAFFSLIFIALMSVPFDSREAGDTAIRVWIACTIFIIIPAFFYYSIHERTMVDSIYNYTGSTDLSPLDLSGTQLRKIYKYNKKQREDEEKAREAEEEKERQIQNNKRKQQIKEAIINTDWNK